MPCWPWIDNRTCNQGAWRSPKIAVSEDTFARLGVVDIADITQDEIVAIKAGHILTASEIEQVIAAAGNLALQIDDDFYLAPLTTSTICLYSSIIPAVRMLDFGVR
jgi:hypothetical protein